MITSKIKLAKHEIVADYYALKGILDVVAERLKVELNLKATQVIPSLHPEFMEKSSIKIK